MGELTVTVAALLEMKTRQKRINSSAFCPLKWMLIFSKKIKEMKNGDSFPNLQMGLSTIFFQNKVKRCKSYNIMLNNIAQ